MKDIHLSVKRGLFRSDDPSREESNSDFKKIRTVILKRDNYTCQYCGFRAKKYQEVHHLDDNHSNNDEKNLITVCALCHSCFHIGLAGIKERGLLIYLPPSSNITQAELNQLVRTLWVGEKNGNVAVVTSSTNILSRLKKRTIEARRTIGTSDPTILGDFLLNIDGEKYDERGKSIKGIYLLPLKEAFSNQLDYWSTSVFNSIPADAWIDIADQKIKRWAENKFGNSKDISIREMLNIE